MADRDEVLSALSAIDPALLDYQQWLNVGMALKDGGFDCSMWDDWSREDPARYHRGECIDKWDGFSGSGITLSTLFDLAYMNGWSNPNGWNGEGGELDWNDTINDDYKIVDPSWLETEEFKEPGDEWNPVSDIKRYLSAVFDAEDSVGYVIDAYQDKEGEKWHPGRKGNYDRTAGRLLEELEVGDIRAVFGDYNEAAGVWIRFNPLDGLGVKNSNVTEYKYTLVESDNTALDRQLAIIRELELPCAALVYSGGKSIHAIVKIDAGTDKAEYKKRVDYLYDICEKNGMKVDRQNKNESRLSRAPGFMRNGHKQFLIDTNTGKRTWKEWVDFIESVNDDLPDVISMDDVWDNIPDLAPELIEGILRQGHKMLLAGPSKAGKSFLLIELCIAIAEGLTWIGRKCAKGKVLYVNLELDYASCLHRFRDVYKQLGVTPSHNGNLMIWNLRGKSEPMNSLTPKLIRRCQKENYIAVIIDPIYKVITGDENSAEQMAKFCNEFDKVATGLGCSVVYCHHHSKGAQGGKRSMDRASGSGVFARDPDALIDLIELTVSDEVKDEVRKKMETQMVLELCKDASNWKLRGEVKDKTDYISIMNAFYRTWPDYEAEKLVKAVTAKVEGMSAWRADCTLREFQKPPQTDLWFGYPLHYADNEGLLKDAMPDEDLLPHQRGSKKNASGKSKEERKNDRLDRLEIAFANLEMDGEVTKQALADELGVSARTVDTYIKESGNFIIENRGNWKNAVVKRNDPPSEKA